MKKGVCFVCKGSNFFDEQLVKVVAFCVLEFGFSLYVQRKFS